MPGKFIINGAGEALEVVKDLTFPPFGGLATDLAFAGGGGTNPHGT